MARYFLTGATGFLGSRLAEQLRAGGHEVVAIARDPSRAELLVRIGVEIHRGDITDPATLRGPMEGADGIFHLAAWYKIGVRDKRPAWAINVEGTRNVLEAMRDLGIRKGVYTSTLAVLSDTHGQVRDETYVATQVHQGGYITEYDRTKHAAHYEVALPMIHSGLPLVILMPGLVYGPGDESMAGETLRNYIRGKLPAVPRGTAFCWAHVDDVARAHVLAMLRGRPGETYIVAGPCHTVAEALKIAERITGVPAPARRIPPAALKAAAALFGVAERIVDLPPAYSPEGLRVLAGATYLGNNGKARAELGYEPRSLEAGLGETLREEMARLGVGPRAGGR